MRGWAFILAVVLTGPAAAQEVDCMAAMDQATMNLCAEQEWQDADLALNEAYASAMDILKGWDGDLPEDQQGAAKALKTAQRAWITFRDAACEAEAYAMQGGSAQPLLVFGCRARLTRARTEDLRVMSEPY